MSLNINLTRIKPDAKQTRCESQTDQMKYASSDLLAPCIVTSCLCCLPVCVVVVVLLRCILDKSVVSKVCQTKIATWGGELEPHCWTLEAIKPFLEVTVLLYFSPPPIGFLSHSLLSSSIEINRHLRAMSDSLRGK